MHFASTSLPLSQGQDESAAVHADGGFVRVCAAAKAIGAARSARQNVQIFLTSIRSVPISD